MAADENGVSTSAVRNPTRFSAPWDYVPQTFDPAVAWGSLKAKLETVEGARIVEEDRENFYIHATAPASTPPGSVDDLEFILNPAEKLVFYRSVTRD